MFIALNHLIYSLRQERHVIRMNTAHRAPLER
jgi:hypothetical protein